MNAAIQSDKLRRVPFLLTAACLLFAVACGEDYLPPSIETTGVAAERLDQILDLEISLPGLKIQDSFWTGVDLELRLELRQTGYGRFPATVVYDFAKVDGREVEVQDLSGGKTTVTYTPTAWATEPLGPLIVDGTAFEVLLSGAADSMGWHLGGASYETQTATQGSFEGWRRHRFLVAGTDFSSSAGAVAEVSLVKGFEIRVRPRVELVSSDPVLRLTHGAVFAVNRFTFDNLQRLDPSLDFRTTWQAGVGSGSNPQDVLLPSAEKGYVSRYEPPYNDVAVFDPGTGEILSTIPLGELAENTDGTPRASRLVLADGTVFVGLQDIDRSFLEFGEGKLAVIDPLLDEVVGSIPLGGVNPWEIEVVYGEDGRTRLYVALAGVFGSQELSGGIVVVDVTNRAVERLALDDDDAGGNIGGLALASERLGYVIVTDESFLNHVKAFDPRDGTILRTIQQSYDYIPELKADSGGLLAVPDRSFFQPRLCLYRTPIVPDAVEIPLGCAALPLPPSSVEALD